MAELTFVDKKGLSYLLSKIKKEIKRVDRKSLEANENKISIKGFKDAN